MREREHSGYHPSPRCHPCNGDCGAKHTAGGFLLQNDKATLIPPSSTLLIPWPCLLYLFKPQHPFNPNTNKRERERDPTLMNNALVPFSPMQNNAYYNAGGYNAGGYNTNGYNTGGYNPGSQPNSVNFGGNFGGFPSFNGIPSFPPSFPPPRGGGFPPSFPPNFPPL